MPTEGRSEREEKGEGGEREERSPKCVSLTCNEKGCRPLVPHRKKGKSLSNWKYYTHTGRGSTAQFVYARESCDPGQPHRRVVAVGGMLLVLPALVDWSWSRCTTVHCRPDWSLAVVVNHRGWDISEVI